MTRLLHILKQKYQHRTARYYKSREVEALLNEEAADELVAEVMAKVRKDPAYAARY